VAVSEVLISTLGALAGAGVGGYASYKAAGPYWERAKLSAAAPLVKARIAAYNKLWKLTEYSADDELEHAKRLRRRDELLAWYYENTAGGAAGLLLSDAARRQFRTAREKLVEDEPPDHQGIQLAMSCLRTRLKQDVYVHDPDIDDTDCRGQAGWTKPPEGAKAWRRLVLQRIGLPPRG
jgi:hypothetical protein